MWRKIFLIIVLSSGVLTLLSALDDRVFLQSTPIFEGEKLFMERLEAVKAVREPLALVLSGGSARAYAHIGVLRQLEQKDIKPDFIVANSMGAIIGLLYAAGFAADDIECIVRSLDLNDFFDIVLPLRGGIISTRYFEEALSRLFPQRTFDIKNSIIPIIVPTEDLYSKRQVWFSQGDISRIITAAFAMPFMMEPVAYVLEDGTESLLIDSGAIDLGSLSIAASFTTNIIVSTALYEPTLNYYNPVVILNRTFSIGKERALVSDYLALEPTLLRNDVEHFSYMDYFRVDEIIKKGDETVSTILNADREIISGSFSSLKGLDELRVLRRQATQAFCTEITTGGRYPYSREPIFGMKLRPNLSVIDSPLFMLTDDQTFGLYGFFDFQSLFFRTGIHSDIFTHYGLDLFTRLRTPLGFQFHCLASYKLPYEDYSKGRYFGGALGLWQLPVVNRSFFSPYAELEICGNEVARPDFLFMRAGLSFDRQDANSLAFSVNPYVFIQSANLADPTKGFGLQSFIDVRPLAFLGGTLEASFRFSPEQEAVVVLPADVYRGKLSSQFTDSAFSFLALTRGKLYWYSLDSSLTVMELFKLEKIKIGVFGDVLVGYSNRGPTTLDYSQILGLFTRTTISLSGLSTFTIEAGAGWDFQGQSLEAYLSFARYW